MKVYLLLLLVVLIVFMPNVGDLSLLNADVSFNYMGCFKSNGYYDMGGMRKNRGNMNTKECLDTCLKRNFYYFATQYSKYCYCGNNVVTNGETYRDNICNYTCVGDVNENCGGNFMRSFYEIIYTLSKDSIVTEYEGCFRNESRIDLMSFSNKFMNVSNCVYVCAVHGYDYAKLQYQRFCHCGNEMIDSQLEESSCNFACIADSRFMCGGNMAQNVFKLNYMKFSCPSEVELNEIFVCTIKYNNTDSLVIFVDFGDGQLPQSFFRPNELYLNATHAYQQSGLYSVVVSIKGKYLRITRHILVLNETRPTVPTMTSGYNETYSDSYTSSYESDFITTEMSSLISIEANSTISMESTLTTIYIEQSLTTPTDVTNSSESINTKIAETSSVSSTQAMITTDFTTTYYTTLDSYTSNPSTILNQELTTQISATTSRTETSLPSTSSFASTVSLITNSSVTNFFSDSSTTYSTLNPTTILSTLLGNTSISTTSQTSETVSVSLSTLSFLTSSSSYLTTQLTRDNIMAIITSINLTQVLDSLASAGSNVSFSSLNTMVINSVMINYKSDLSGCLMNCSNAGVCQYSAILGKLVCNCQPDYGGDSCQTIVNPCKLKTCLNNGTCVVNSTTSDEFTCVCTRNYYGDKCQYEVDFCANVTCSHKGTCKINTTSTTYTPTCQCFKNYYGASCENEAQELVKIKQTVTVASIIAIVTLVTFYLIFIILDVFKYLIFKLSSQATNARLDKNRIKKITSPFYRS